MSEHIAVATHAELQQKYTQMSSESSCAEQS